MSAVIHRRSAEQSNEQNVVFKCKQAPNSVHLRRRLATGAVCPVALGHALDKDHTSSSSSITDEPGDCTVSTSVLVKCALSSGLSVVCHATFDVAKMTRRRESNQSSGGVWQAASRCASFPPQRRAHCLPAALTPRSDGRPASVGGWPPDV